MQREEFAVCNARTIVNPYSCFMLAKSTTSDSPVSQQGAKELVVDVDGIASSFQARRTLGTRLRRHPNSSAPRAFALEASRFAAATHTGRGTLNVLVGHHGPTHVRTGISIVAVGVAVVTHPPASAASPASRRGLVPPCGCCGPLASAVAPQSLRFRPRRQWCEAHSIPRDIPGQEKRRVHPSTRPIQTGWPTPEFLIRSLIAPHRVACQAPPSSRLAKPAPPGVAHAIHVVEEPSMAHFWPTKTKGHREGGLMR